MEFSVGQDSDARIKLIFWEPAFTGLMCLTDNLKGEIKPVFKKKWRNVNLTIQINQINHHFLEFLDYQDSDATINEEEFFFESCDAGL